MACMLLVACKIMDLQECWKCSKVTKCSKMPMDVNIAKLCCYTSLDVVFLAIGFISMDLIS